MHAQHMESRQYKLRNDQMHTVTCLVQFSDSKHQVITHFVSRINVHSIDRVRPPPEIFRRREETTGILSNASEIEVILQFVRPVQYVLVSDRSVTLSDVPYFQ